MIMYKYIMTLDGSMVEFLPAMWVTRVLFLANMHALLDAQEPELTLCHVTQC